MTKRVCSASAPRIRTAVTPPGPPLRVTPTPGVVASRSETTRAWRSRITSPGMTVTLRPLSAAATGVRLATTTSGSTAVPGGVTARAVAPASMARLMAPSFERQATAGAAATGVSGPRARTGPVCRRSGETPSSRRTPARRMTTASGRSPGSRVTVPCASPSRPGPRGFPASGLVTRGLAAYSCGGSPGLAPEFPFHLPFGRT